jgi:hypothetical protein
LPARLARLPARPYDGWGAFVVYAGLDASLLPPDLELHHQVIVRRPLGEGNTVFASLSPTWDDSRAPAGCRALTISTHTALDRWWPLLDSTIAPHMRRKKCRDDRKDLLAKALKSAIPGTAPGSAAGDAWYACYVSALCSSKVGLGGRFPANRVCCGRLLLSWESICGWLGIRFSQGSRPQQSL